MMMWIAVAIGQATPMSLTVSDELTTTLNPRYGEALADLRAQELVWERLFYHGGAT